MKAYPIKQHSFFFTDISKDFSTFPVAQMIGQHGETEKEVNNALRIITRTQVLL